MKIDKLILLLSVVFLFTNCVQKEIIFNKPKMQIPKPPKAVNKKKGALYSVQGSSLFADKKDLQIGDIIQVEIDEQLKKDSSMSRKLDQASMLNLAGAGITSRTGDTTKELTQLNKYLGLGFGVDTGSSFNGKSTSASDEQFSTTISVIIEETYQNGNYYIKGAKEMLINDQQQKIILSGIIRPYDISPENTILSSQIANLKIFYEKEGDEADVIDKPWGSRVLDIIWPF